MQILHWLFKTQPDQEPPTDSGPISDTKPDGQNCGKSKEIVAARRDTKRGADHQSSSTSSASYKLNCESLGLLRFLQRKDISKPFFYHTLHLKRVGRQMKKEDLARMPNKAEITGPSHVGNKVLPITEHSSAQSSADKKEKEKVKGDKPKAVARMRELMKWAAFQKGVKHGIGRKMLNFKMNRGGGLKSVGDHEDEFSNESPKISFRWDVESCSTTSSVYSSISKASSSFKNADQILQNTLLHVKNQCGDHDHGINGSWITTDSEFVVLEL